MPNPSLIQQNPDITPGAAAPINDTGMTAPAAPGTQEGLDHPLRPLVTHWLGKIQIALELKKNQFMDDANEAMKFYHGPYDFLYRRDYASQSPGFKMGAAEDAERDFPAPTFMMTLNKVAELVQIFGPVLYHKNPERQVNPREYPKLPVGLLATDPSTAMMEQMLAQQAAVENAQDAARSQVIEAYQNWTPAELGLKDHTRAVIDEGLIKGRGMWVTEMVQPPGTTQRLVGSFFSTVDNWVIDPDAESLLDAKWVALRCIHPVWEVERKYGYVTGSLHGNVESYANQAQYFGDPDAAMAKAQGRTSDMIVYWKIWTKMGIGGRLQGVAPALRQTLDQFGDFCYLVIADTHAFPLNLPPDLIAQPGAAEEIQRRLDWPTPYWIAGKWPFTPLDFHPVPRRVWPMSHIRPALGELKLLNWLYSFLASHIRVSSRDFLAVSKGLAEDIKDALLHGRDYTLLELSVTNGKPINELVQFLQHPQMNQDIWKVIEAVNHNFELRTGLTELVYGESGAQLRSAEEANLKGQQLNVRPDDMATRVEDAMSELGLKEAICARWHLTEDDVRPVLGPLGAFYWTRLVVTTDLFSLVHQLEYRVEAGSTRKPNKDRDRANAQQAMQTIMPLLQQWAFATGQISPVNALIAFWCKTLDIEPEPFLLTPPPPPPPPAAPQGQPSQGSGGHPAPAKGPAPAPAPQQQLPQGPPAAGPGPQQPPPGPPAGGPPAPPAALNGQAPAPVTAPWDYAANTPADVGPGGPPFPPAVWALLAKLGLPAPPRAMANPFMQALAPQGTLTDPPGALLAGANGPL